MPFYYMVGNEALLHNQDSIKDTELPPGILERVRECEWHGKVLRSGVLPETVLRQSGQVRKARQPPRCPFLREIGLAERMNILLLAISSRWENKQDSVALIGLKNCRQLQKLQQWVETVKHHPPPPRQAVWPCVVVPEWLSVSGKLTQWDPS